MKRESKTNKLVVVLIFSSLILYLINYIIFKDFHHIAMFFTEDLAFIPIEVLVTVLIIEKELERIDNQNKLQKINLLIEIFFEEVGTELLAKIASNDIRCINISDYIASLGGSIINNYKEIEDNIENYNYNLSLNESDIDEIYELLYENKVSFLRFIENPYIGEHDIFTDLLQSAIHLSSEIKYRRGKGSINKDDIAHLNRDVSRLYKYLAKEWVVYMKYIEKEYPFLYSFAIDHMPFGKY